MKGTPLLGGNKRVDKSGLLQKDDIRRIVLRKKAENSRFPSGGVGSLNAAKAFAAPTAVVVPHGRSKVVRDMNHVKRIV